MNFILWVTSETWIKAHSGGLLKRYNGLPAKHLKAFNKNQRWFSHKKQFFYDCLTYVGICGMPHKNGSNLSIEV